MGRVVKDSGWRALRRGEQSRTIEVQLTGFAFFTTAIWFLRAGRDRDGFHWTVNERDGFIHQSGRAKSSRSAKAKATRMFRRLAGIKTAVVIG